MTLTISYNGNHLLSVNGRREEMCPKNMKEDKAVSEIWKFRRALADVVDIYHPAILLILQNQRAMMSFLDSFRNITDTRALRGQRIATDAAIKELKGEE